MGRVAPDTDRGDQRDVFDEDRSRAADRSMPSAEASSRPPTVDQPKHPLHALTTFELRDHRRELERAIAFFDKQDSVPPVRGNLQTRLDAVLAEQDERARLARA